MYNLISYHYHLHIREECWLKADWFWQSLPTHRLANHLVAPADKERSHAYAYAYAYACAYPNPSMQALLVPMP